MTYQQQYRLDNKERIAAQKKAHRQANWKDYVNSDYRRHYGKDFTFDTYYELLQGQDSGCKVCGYMPDCRLYVDHCHTTGKVRGLLCNECNVAIGLLRDNTALMRRAANYVEQGGNVLYN